MNAAAEKRLTLELYPDSVLPELLLGDVELEGAEPKGDARILLVGHSPRQFEEGLRIAQPPARGKRLTRSY